VNPANGIEYNVAVQVPQYKIDSMQDPEYSHRPRRHGVTAASPRQPRQVNVNVEPALLSHYNAQPMVNVYASVEGRDLGGVADDIQKVLTLSIQASARHQLELRGQVSTMNSSFVGLGAGVAVAIVLVYLLIVVNFQSWLDPFIIITALPGALAGICGCC
jgi:multidrug efflux pump subunit AcrB